MKTSATQIAVRLVLAASVYLGFGNAALAADRFGTPQAVTARHSSTPIAEPVIDREQRVQLARVIADARRAEAPAKLTKEELRLPMHLFVPLLSVCYQRAAARDPDAEGVFNTKLAIDSVAGQGTIFSVRGFDTAGVLGRSMAFLACLKKTAEAIVLPPIGAGGSAEITYPITFAPLPPDNRQTELADRSAAAAAAGRWADALLSAEGGLKLTALDGTFRRKLIAIAGVAACHLKRRAKARQYYALASAAFEGEIREACSHDTGIDLRRQAAR